MKDTECLRGHVPGDVIGVLGAERDIRRQMHNFCHGVNELDVELLASVWHLDGSLDFEEPAARGPAAEWVGVIIEGYEPWSAHFLQDCSSLISTGAIRCTGCRNREQRGEN